MFKPSNVVCMAMAGVLIMKDQSASASYNQVANGVVRIELKRQYVPHHEIIELEEAEGEDA